MPMPVRCFLVSVTVSCSFALPVAVLAQAPGDTPTKAPFAPAQATPSQLPLPSPYDKMEAVEQAVEVPTDWTTTYDAIAMDIDADAQSDKSSAALALGVKLADAQAAMKTKNADNLNQNIIQIEILAKKLGATDGDLERGSQVREKINNEAWLDAFLEFGFLQTDIMRALDKPENANMRRLTVASGWLQGTRYLTAYLSENYDEESSNVLREPLLVGELARDLNALPLEISSHSRVQGIPQSLTDALVIVSVPKEQPISQENVDKLKSTVDDAVQAALGLPKSQ